MRGLSCGERAILYQDGPEEPDYRDVFRRVSTRRKGPFPCDACGEVIEVGQRYQTAGFILDGDFQIMRHHLDRCPPVQRILSEGAPPEWAGREEDLL